MYMHAVNTVVWGGVLESKKQQWEEARCLRHEMSKKHSQVQILTAPPIRSSQYPFSPPPWSDPHSTLPPSPTVRSSQHIRNNELWLMFIQIFSISFPIKKINPYGKLTLICLLKHIDIVQHIQLCILHMVRQSLRIWNPMFRQEGTSSRSELLERKEEIQTLTSMSQNHLKSILVLFFVPVYVKVILEALKIHVFNCYRKLIENSL